MNSDHYTIVHPPMIDKIDKSYHAQTPYDGYGSDKRSRVSQMIKFDEKTENP